MFDKAFKPYRTGLKFKSHCSFSTLPLWPSVHFFHQCFWPSYMLLSSLFPNVSLSHTVNFFFFFILFWKHFLSGPKKRHCGRDLSVYEHTWKENYFHIKELILYVHFMEQNKTLWSYALDFEGKNQQWQMVEWVIWEKRVHVHSSCTPNNQIFKIEVWPKQFVVIKYLAALRLFLTEK